jgi:hypothetical protein
MAAGMNVVSLAMVPAWIGTTGHHTLMMAGHELMLLGMLVAMLARWWHYSDLHHELLIRGRRYKLARGLRT